MTREQALNVLRPQGNSLDDLKIAYRQACKKYHPDINKASDAHDRFKEINEAAAVLGDDKKRQQYDHYGTDARQFGYDFSGFDFSGFGKSFDFEDLFEDLFGGGFSGFGSRQRGSERGSDLRYDLQISLEEVNKLLVLTEEIISELSVNILDSNWDYQLSGNEKAGRILEAYSALKEKREREFKSDWDDFVKEIEKKN